MITVIMSSTTARAENLETSPKAQTPNVAGESSAARGGHQRDNQQNDQHTNTPATPSEKISPEKIQSHTQNLVAWLEQTLLKNGYDLVSYDIHTGRDAKLSLYIDFLPGNQPTVLATGPNASMASPTASPTATPTTSPTPTISTTTAQQNRISLEDCVNATRLIDEPLDTNDDANAIFAQGYELEVSSPGIDRPLRKLNDFERFTGEIARIHTIRAVLPNEANDQDYLAKNPKQKNFYGILRGVQHLPADQPQRNTQANMQTTPSILMGIIPEDGSNSRGASAQNNSKSNSKNKKTNQKPVERLFTIPFPLISKAHLIKGDEIK